MAPNMGLYQFFFLCSENAEKREGKHVSVNSDSLLYSGFFLSTYTIGCNMITKNGIVGGETRAVTSCLEQEHARLSFRI